LTNNQYFDKKINMKYKDKTKEQLINELAELHQRIEDLEAEATIRKKAEEALKVSEARYRGLFEAAQDGIVLLDADTGQMLDVNPFLLKMLG
jgi:PAS domain-containing protein